MNKQKHNLYMLSEKSSNENLIPNLFQTYLILIKKAVKISYNLNPVWTHTSRPKEEAQMAVFIDQC